MDWSTPTPFPTPAGPSPIQLTMIAPQEFGTAAVQGWQLANQSGVLTTLQAFIVIAILVMGAVAIVAALQEL